MPHVLNCFDDSSWTTSFSRRAINNLIQLLYPQLWPRKRGFLGFTPLWWWQRPHRCPHRSHTSDLQRAKQLMVPSQRCCGMEVLLLGDIPSMVVTAVDPELHRERWKQRDEVERVRFCNWKSKYLLQDPTKQSFWPFITCFQGCLPAHRVFFEQQLQLVTSSFCIQLVLPVYFACAKVQIHIICPIYMPVENA